MTIVFLICFLVLLLSVKGTESNQEGYLSIEYTNIIKGFFLIFVFIRHFLQYRPDFQNGWLDDWGIALDAKGGQLLVTMFLFYSGYGLMESAKKKGEAYIRQLPKKRILHTLINFDVAVLIYMAVTVLLLDYEVTVKRVLLSLTGWDNFANSNWYIFCILFMYFIAYVSLKAFGVTNKAVISIVVGIWLFTLALGVYKDGYWYNTAFCYGFGCFYSVNREKIEQWLETKELLMIFYVAMLFIFSYHNKGVREWYYVHALAFVGIVLIVTRRVQLKNRFLAWMGKNLFPLYIFQRLPMLLLKDISYIKENPYVFFVVAAVITLMIACIYNQVYKAGQLLTGQKGK